MGVKMLYSIFGRKWDKQTTSKNLSKLTEKGRKPITLHIPEKANFLFFHIRQIRWLKKFEAFSKELAEINYVHTRDVGKYRNYQSKNCIFCARYFFGGTGNNFFNEKVICAKNLDWLLKKGGG